MRQRGRKGNLAVVPESGDLRPGPPEDLTDSERELWLAIVNEKPASWFDAATVPLLTDYCRLKTQLDLLAAALAEFTPALLKESSAAARHRGFMQARDRSQKTMAMLATKMRLAQQSRYEDRTAGTRARAAAAAAPRRRPWQTDG